MISLEGDIPLKQNFMKPSVLIFLLVLTLTNCAQKSTVSIEDARTEILALHNAQRVFHFQKDSVAFVNQLSADFISVNAGVISTPSKEATQSRYHTYFSAVEFVRWDDVSDPIVRFSEDGSLAYTIVDKIVEVQYENENGQSVSSETHFAWTAIYRRHGKSWKVESVTSTDRVASS